jgi:hypothetical protein
VVCRNVVHGDVEESFVEERDTSFEAPGHGGFVSAEVVGGVQVLDTLDAFVVKGLGRGRLMEIQVAWKKKKKNV